MLIERLQVRGLLSFGPDGVDLPLEPLNVLIGPNGAGKSNLLKTFGLLQSVPTDISKHANETGTALDWFWEQKNLGLLQRSKSPRPIGKILEQTYTTRLPLGHRDAFSMCPKRKSVTFMTIIGQFWHGPTPEGQSTKTTKTHHLVTCGAYLANLWFAL